MLLLLTLEGPCFFTYVLLYLCTALINYLFTYVHVYVVFL